MANEQQEARVAVAPREIYLQLYGEDHYGDGPYVPSDEPSGFFDEVTWCPDNIFNTDVKYVRADIAEAEKQAAYNLGGEAGVEQGRHDERAGIVKRLEAAVESVRETVAADSSEVAKGVLIGHLASLRLIDLDEATA